MTEVEATQPNKATGGSVKLQRFIRYAAGTDIGKKRSENQDSFGVVDGTSFHVLIVADGMGGALGGAVASKLAVQTIKELLSKKTAISPKDLVHAIERANTVINEQGSNDPKTEGMGTTIVCLALVGSKAFVAHVGDSRLYRVRNDRIEPLTDDHTLVQELLRDGSIGKDAVDDHPASHVLTRSLGPSESVEIDCRELDGDVQDGDRFLLCSDGLYNLVSEQEMLDTCANDTLDNAVQSMINTANSRGGTDNITVIVAEASIRLEGESIEDAIERISRESKARANRKQGRVGGRRITFRDLLPIFLSLGVAFALGYWFRLQSREDTSQQLATEANTTIKFNHPVRAEEATKLTVETELRFDAIPPPLALLLPIEGNRASSAIVIPDKVTSTNSVLTGTGRQEFEKRLSRLQDGLRSVDQRLKGLDGDDRRGDALDQILRNEQLIKDIQGEIAAVAESLDRTTRKLSVWFDRSRRLTLEDPLNLVNEVAASMDGVRKLKAQFEQDSWDYLSQLEKARLSPEDSSLTPLVREAKQKRDESMARLVTEIKQSVATEVSKTQQEISNLTARSDELKQKRTSLQLDQEFHQARASKDVAVKNQVRQKILNERAAMESELMNLKEILSGR